MFYFVSKVVSSVEVSFVRLSGLNRAQTGKRERKREGNDGKGKAVSLRFFFFIDPCAF